MRIDCQTHVFPPAYIDILARNSQGPRVEKEGNGLVIMLGDRPTLRIREGHFDLSSKLEEMDQWGIDMSILSPQIPGPCMLAPDLAVQGARAMNDYIAEVMEKYPGRFAGIASLPWQDVDAAIREMDRAQDDLGFCGVMLFSHIGGRPVDDPVFERAYAHAEKKGLPIVIHPTFPSWVEPQVFVELLEGMNISEDEKARIFSGNAMSLFNLQ